MSDSAATAVISTAPAPKPRAAPKKLVAKAKRLIAVGGGKGGIGKTLVSAGLAQSLAARGARVVVVDLDLGGANLHTCLALPQAKATLGDFLAHRVDSLDALLTQTSVERLQVISGATDALDAANPKHASKGRLLRHLRALDADFVLLDLGAGTSFNTLDFFLAADLGLVVLLPEPTSIENAYRFIKAAFFRKLQAVVRPQTADVVGRILAGQDPGLRTPWDYVAKLRERDDDSAQELELALGDFHPWLVLNQARNRADFDVGSTVAMAWKKFFGLELGTLGVLPYDEAVWQSVRARKPLLSVAPESPAAQGLWRVAENLLSLSP